MGGRLSIIGEGTRASAIGISCGDCSDDYLIYSTGACDGEGGTAIIQEGMLQAAAVPVSEKF